MADVYSSPVSFVRMDNGSTYTAEPSEKNPRLVFGALLSLIMTSAVSAFVIAITQGVPPDFVVRWVRPDLAGDLSDGDVGGAVGTEGSGIFDGVMHLLQ